MFYQNHPLALLWNIDRDFITLFTKYRTYLLYIIALYIKILGFVLKK